MKPHHTKIMRYMIAGGSAAIINITIFSILSHHIGIWYVWASVIAFLGAFGVSFVLQKFWTYRDHDTAGVHVQGLIYLVVTVINLGVNTVLIWILVQHLHVFDVLAQVIAGGLIACVSYFVYGKFVFNKK